MVEEASSSVLLEGAPSKPYRGRIQRHISFTEMSLLVRMRGRETDKDDI